MNVRCSLKLPLRWVLGSVSGTGPSGPETIFLADQVEQLVTVLDLIRARAAA
jgi:hypothetical protein